MQRAEDGLPHRGRRQRTHAMLAIEGVHLCQVFEELRVIRECHASRWAGDEEARCVHRGQRAVIVATHR